MKIVFSNTIFFLQKYGGISRYFVNLSKELNKIKVDSRIIAPLSKNIYLKKEKQNNIFLYLKRFPNNFFLKKINQILFYFLLKIEKPNIIHETYYDENNLKIFKNTIKVLTIYDLVHEKFSKFYSKKKSLEKIKILRYVDHFICISKKTQSDFVKYYNIPKSKTSVIYLGSDHLKNLYQSDKCSLSIPNKFFLYVGSRDGYKNFKILVEAFNFARELKNINVVCFGGGNFSNFEISNYKLSHNFIYCDGDDSLLCNLYTKAIGFINTSKYEGFGITNIEAMYFGCPVISSNFEVFKEIAGNACLYFKNNNSLDLAQKIKKFLLNSNIRKIYIDRGIKRAKLFTWNKCAEQTSQLYKSLLK